MTVFLITESKKYAVLKFWPCRNNDTGKQIAELVYIKSGKKCKKAGKKPRFFY